MEWSRKYSFQSISIKYHIKVILVYLKIVLNSIWAKKSYLFIDEHWINMYVFPQCMIKWHRMSDCLFWLCCKHHLSLPARLVFSWQYWSSAGRSLMHPHVSPMMASHAPWLMQLLYDQAKLSSHLHWYPVTFDEHTIWTNGSTRH